MKKIRGIFTYNEIDSRGLEIYLALALFSGEANIVSATLNKQQGFFTFNVGSQLFDWRNPLVVSANAKTASSLLSLEEIDVGEFNSGLNQNFAQKIRNDNDSSNNNIILMGIFLLAVFLFENPFVCIENNN